MEGYFELMSEPEVFQVELLHDDKTRSIQVSRDEHIWDAAFKAGIVLPALCHQGYCLTCAARLENSGEIDQTDSAQYYPDDREPVSSCSAPASLAPTSGSEPIKPRQCANFAKAEIFPPPIPGTQASRPRTCEKTKSNQIY